MKKIILILIYLSSQLLANSGTLFSYSKSKRSVGSITVTSGSDVKYESSSFTKIQLSQKLYDDYEAGFNLVMSDDTQDVVSYSGAFATKNWFYSIEQAKLTGDFVKSDGSIQSSFKDNNYLDIKILKKRYDKDDEGLSIGVQYMQYERASVFRQNSIVYTDPKLKVKFIGYVLEYDHVKRELFNTKLKSKNDWYFYTTTALGFGTLTTSNDIYKYNNPDIAGNYSKSWSGFGINAEYELGYVRYQKIFGLNTAFKIGYLLGVSGPASTADMFDDFEAGGDVIPNEQLVSHGYNFTLISVF